MRPDARTHTYKHTTLITHTLSIEEHIPMLYKSPEQFFPLSIQTFPLALSGERCCKRYERQKHDNQDTSAFSVGRRWWFSFWGSFSVICLAGSFSGFWLVYFFGLFYHTINKSLKILVTTDTQKKYSEVLIFHNFAFGIIYL